MDVQINKPNFFIIGASKCATTSLWHILRNHPNVFMSEAKEPSFFVRDNYKDRMLRYLALFEAADGEKVVGEASPVYSETTVFPEIGKRIYEFNPDAKIIYLVRNPFTRVLSVWKQTLSSGHWYRNVYKEDFGNDNIGLMPLNFREALFNYPPFVEASRYWTHLKHYLNYFSEENVLLLYFEEFIQSPEIILEKIYKFLNINYFYDPVIVKKPRNNGSQKKKYANWYIYLDPHLKRRFQNSVPPILFSKIVKRKINVNNLMTSKIKKDIIDSLSDEISTISNYSDRELDYLAIN